MKRLLAVACLVSAVACDGDASTRRDSFELTGFVRLVLDQPGAADASPPPDTIAPGGVVLLVQDPDEDLACGLENGDVTAVLFGENTTFDLAGLETRGGFPDNLIGRRVTAAGDVQTIDGTCVLVASQMTAASASPSPAPSPARTAEDDASTSPPPSSPAAASRATTAPAATARPASPPTGVPTDGPDGSPV